MDYFLGKSYWYNFLNEEYSQIFLLTIKTLANILKEDFLTTWLCNWEYIFMLFVRNKSQRKFTAVE